MPVILSIIIPAYNCRAYIDDCLSSVLSQLPEDAEVIIVDDGSNDGCAEYLTEAYAHGAKNIRLFRSRHGGASHARNIGLDNARGTFIAFLDCYDRIKQGFLANSQAYLHDCADMFIFGIERFELSGNRSLWTVENNIYPDVHSFADDYIRKRKLLIYSNCNKFYRRSVIERLGLRFDEDMSFGEDRLFNYRFLTGGKKIITCSDIMLEYVQRSRESMSSRHIHSYFQHAMELHKAKMKCFLDLSRDTTQDERLDFLAYDCAHEIEIAVDRFPHFPEEELEDLPKINRLLFGGDNCDDYSDLDILIVTGSPNCEYRVRKAFEIGSSNPEMIYILSGGNPHKNAHCTEAQFMAEYLSLHGVPDDKIFIENRAVNTEENLIYSSELVRRINISGARIAIISAAFHIPRVKLLVKRLNIFTKEYPIFIGAYGENTGLHNWYKNDIGKIAVLTDFKKRIKLGVPYAVAIDPGHQLKGNPMQESIGPGASQTKPKVAASAVGRFTGLAEHELNLRVGLLLRDELERFGYRVIMTRTANDVNISNSERAKIAEASHADIFVRIHANSSYNPDDNGALTICMTPENPYCSRLYQQSRRLSEYILDALCNETGTRNNGVLETDTMSGINWASMPVTIVEMGFMSNEKEDNLMSTADYQAKLARGIADGINKYFGLCFSLDLA